jgi:glycosyltransferase involved in cell wall biosynthesis
MSNGYAAEGGAPSEVIHIVGDGNAGGGTTVVLQLAGGLQQRGVKVTVAGPYGSYLLTQAEGAGHAVLGLDFSNRLKTGSVARTVMTHLRGHRPALVHAHGARAGLAAALLPSSSRRALVYTVHGFHYGDKRFGIRHLAMAAERACMQRATATVFVSSHDASHASRARLLPTGAVSEIIYNGSVPAKPAEGEPRFDLVFLGRLHRQKNPLILPEILERLAPLRPSLGIIGSGEFEPKLRAQIQASGLLGQVTFLGERSHLEAMRLLSRARIMVLPSRWEGLPVSVLEAMHRGIAVVASDVPGTDELVVEGETGFLVPPADAAAYADRIDRLLSDEGARRRMGARALERARAVFSLESQLDSHMALYEHSRLAGAEGLPP